MDDPFAEMREVWERRRWRAQYGNLTSPCKHTRCLVCPRSLPDGRDSCFQQVCGICSLRCLTIYELRGEYATQTNHS